MRRLGLLIATCGYLGYSPVAPGTVGSAVGLLVFAAVRLTGSPVVELGVIAAIFALGVWSGSAAERHFGAVDPAPVIVDEVVGMLITLLMIPVTVPGAIAGFFLFRVFDVLKPWPANRMERLPGGLGVMADDAMAAVYSNIALRLLVAVVPAGWLT